MKTTKAQRIAEQAKREARHAEARAIVASGVCPYCGAGIRRNLALAGWFQCDQFGAVGFRKDANAPACGFQTFTE